VSARVVFLFAATCFARRERHRIPLSRPTFRCVRGCSPESCICRGQPETRSGPTDASHKPQRTLEYRPNEFVSDGSAFVIRLDGLDGQLWSDIDCLLGPSATHAIPPMRTSICLTWVSRVTANTALKISASCVR